MKIMCDTNIIIDILLEREPFVDDSYKVLSLCEEHKVKKYTHSTELAYNAVGKVLEIVKICSVTNDDVLTAFQRKAKDFEEFDIPLLTPTEFLEQFSK